MEGLPDEILERFVANTADIRKAKKKEKFYELLWKTIFEKRLRRIQVNSAVNVSAEYLWIWNAKERTECSIFQKFVNHSEKRKECSYL